MKTWTRVRVPTRVTQHCEEDRFVSTLDLRSLARSLRDGKDVTPIYAFISHSKTSACGFDLMEITFNYWLDTVRVCSPGTYLTGGRLSDTRLFFECPCHNFMKRHPVTASSSDFCGGARCGYLVAVTWSTRR